MYCCSCLVCIVVVVLCLLLLVVLSVLLLVVLCVLLLLIISLKCLSITEYFNMQSEALKPLFRESLRETSPLVYHSHYLSVFSVTTNTHFANNFITWQLVSTLNSGHSRSDDDDPS
jgi:hypothetical protein